MSIQNNTQMKIKELRAKGRLLEPSIRLGKNGITDSIIDEIKKRLKKESLIKVKMLNNFSEKQNKKQAAVELAEKTGSVLVDQVGFVVVLLKKDDAKKDR